MSRSLVGPAVCRPAAESQHTGLDACRWLGLTTTDKAPQTTLEIGIRGRAFSFAVTRAVGVSIGARQGREPLRILSPAPLSPALPERLKAKGPILPVGLERALSAFYLLGTMRACMGGQSNRRRWKSLRSPFSLRISYSGPTDVAASVWATWRNDWST